MLPNNTAQENLDRQYRIRALGYNVDWLVDRVLGLYGLTFEELIMAGKHRKAVKAWSKLCYWGRRELWMNEVWIPKKLNFAYSAESESTTRGREIIDERVCRLLREAKSENPRNVP